LDFLLADVLDLQVVEVLADDGELQHELVGAALTVLFAGVLQCVIGQLTERETPAEILGKLPPRQLLSAEGVWTRSGASILRPQRTFVEFLCAELRNSE
jgi:hypothetical protein